MYFVLAVACIIASVYFSTLLIFNGMQPRHQRGQAVAKTTLWNPTLFSIAALGTLTIVTLGSLYKTMELSGGGGAVARSMGGRLVNPSTLDPDERKLRNVVEEMAIASGVPVPAIYVMDDQQSINAFAAGSAPTDAAIAVTRGCMTLLNRDELQGVIGHEFSHILNGDMRLNLRLIGVLFGILCLTTLGRILLQMRSSRDRDKNPLPLLGIALLVIGWIGWFFGRLIQSAVSRQREFLADASAVQFTRNPSGLSGALQKIGARGSTVHSAHAEEMSHMYFGNGLGDPFMDLLATHPPLEERIRAIDPAWDGQFKWKGKTPAETEAAQQRLSRVPGMQAGVAGLTGNVVTASSVLPNLGKVTIPQLRYAEELRNSFSDNIHAAARAPLYATALVYALLLSPDATLRAQQLAELTRQLPPELAERTAALWPEVAPIATRARLPLINLALPALRYLPPDDLAQFTNALQYLIASDGEIDLFEFVLQQIIRRHLTEPVEGRRPGTIHYYTLKPLVPDCNVVLSALAYASHDQPHEIDQAFRAGATHLEAKSNDLQLLPPEAAGLAEVSAALERLVLAAPQIKKQLIEACAHAVGADGLIHEREAELLRAVAETLDCPIPPFVELTV